ncbi:monocarboxylate transporter 10-like [Haliotis rufescens]|uniref:monocarboxylate transporter 10-like n=1 Tax=Haliotis rufescens TaxID=6454 RepID=UPI00201EEB2B|nr:monocarboxylate transporter 10-like [Haliotis rufescens]
MPGSVISRTNASNMKRKGDSDLHSQDGNSSAGARGATPGNLQGQSDNTEGNSSGVHATCVSSTRAPDFVAPDGGWGWVVCATCFWVNGSVMGTVNTFGILYNHMRELNAPGDEGVSLKTSFIGSCMNGVMFLMCCVSGILCDVIGLRHTALIGGVLCVAGFLSSAFVTKLELLYLTYGVILGSGFGLVFSPMVAITGHYFKNNLGLVNGIVTFGASAFTVAMSFALPYILGYFGLKVTLICYAGLGVTLTFCTLAWKPLITREYSSHGSTRGNTSHVKRCFSFMSWKVLNGRVWKNRQFVTWCVVLSVSRFGYLEPYFHMVNHVAHILPGTHASILITVMAAVSGVCKLAVGKLSDLLRQYRIYLQQGALFVYGVIVICIPFSHTFPGFIVIAVGLGIADAVIMVLFGPNAIELVGAGNASQAIGFSSLLSIPTFLSAPVITGAMHDQLNSYNPGFYMTGAITLVASVFMFLVKSPFQRQLRVYKISPTKPPTSQPTSLGPTLRDEDAGHVNGGGVNEGFTGEGVCGSDSVQTRL